jgi:DhnA family fructose-bisphosphate aldolase class Ia
MGFRDVDARIAGVGVVQQGGPATEPRRLLAQARTLTGGDVGHDDPRLRQVEVRRAHRMTVVGVVHASHGAIVCSPHTRHPKVPITAFPVSAAGFRGIGADVTVGRHREASSPTGAETLRIHRP